jgi:hypothetical protein
MSKSADAARARHHNIMLRQTRSVVNNYVAASSLSGKHPQPCISTVGCAAPPPGRRKLGKLGVCC